MRYTGLAIFLVFSLSLLGREVTQIYEFENVKELHYGGSGKLEILQGEKNSLTLSAAPHLLKRCFISNHHGILTFCSSSSLQGQLVVKELRKIVLIGDVMVDIDYLEGEEFEVEIGGEGTPFLEGNLSFNHLVTTLHGSSQTSFRGAVKEETVFINGSGFYDGKDLTAENTTIRVKGRGRGIIHTKNRLQASIVGNGSIEYIEKPKVIHGKGRIISYE